MEPITLEQLTHAVNGKLVGNFSDKTTTITQIDIDSRKISQGSLFLPIVGENVDGHDYIPSALEQGSAGVLLSKEQESYDPTKFYLLVPNTQKALGDLALWYRRQFTIPFIAITGSVGKTTTKDMVAAALSSKYSVHKTQGNFNSSIGLPLTLLALKKTHEICVLELGMDQAGEIHYLANIAKPDIGVITNIKDSHIEKLGSQEGILSAKCELLPHIKEGGLFVQNADDDLLGTRASSFPKNTLTLGQGDGLDYVATPTGSTDTHTHFKIKTPTQTLNVEVPALGAHMMYPTMTAIAICEKLGLSHDQILKGIVSFAPSKMRMNRVDLPPSITLYDDTYNANPASMKASTEVLASQRSPHKIAVLGDMFELGEHTKSLHFEVGASLDPTKIHALIAIGSLAKHIAEGGRQAGISEVMHCATKEEALPTLLAWTKPNSTLLFKGSRGMALDQLATQYAQKVRETNT
ncbi:MAG: UDP-N-acetylmuramoyl-tripeptide--D-alanyl-D-alanine ligase [Eubacteriales bacterium]